MTDSRDRDGTGQARFQPADVRDLERHPPHHEVCVGIRQMLRDHGDGELRPGDRELVDEHVHACRDCALALSRVELESLRLRQTFEADRLEAFDVPEDLTRRILAAAGEELLAEPDTPPQFTRRVMERVRREWRRPPAWRRVWDRGWPARAGVALAAGLLIAVSVFAVVWLEEGTAAEGVFEVAMARDVVVADQDGLERAARVGEALAAGTRVRTAGDGEALLRRLDQRGQHQAADRPVAGNGTPTGLALDPDTVCVLLGGGGARLIDGTVTVRTDRAWQLDLPDGTRVEFSGSGSSRSGQAWITVERVRLLDGNGVTVRSRVEIVEGRAQIFRGSLVPAPVLAGQVARFDAFSPIEIELSPTPDRIARSARAGRSPAVAGGPVAAQTGAAGREVWHGRVIDSATGRGVGRASVEVRIEDERQKKSSDGDGWFRFDAPRGAIVIVRVTPPEQSSTELASYGPEPILLEAGLAARARRLPPIALAADVPVRGIVRRETGAVVAGARVVPCVIDELFGDAERLTTLEAVTDADGGFVLRGLPSELPRHQVLALLVEGEGLPLSARVGVGAAPSGFLDIVVPTGRVLLVEGFEPGADVRVLREIPGLPLVAVAEQHQAIADGRGWVELRGVGPGALWVFEVGGATAHRLVPAAPGSLRLVAAADQVRDLVSLARLHSEPIPVGAAGGPIAVVADARRYGRIGRVGDLRSARFVDVRVGARVIGSRTRLFLETGDGQLTFLGETDGGTSVPFLGATPPPYRIVAVGEDGSVGVLDSEALARGESEVAMQAPGDVAFEGSLPEALAHGALVAFDALDGPFVGRRFWRLVHPTLGFEIEGLVVGSYAVWLPDGSRWTCTVREGKRSLVVRVEEVDALKGR